jgi:drug/metabolite transporter (DMT)-like permease
MHGVATDRAFPGADLSFGSAEDKREVGFLGFAILELPTEFAVSGVRLGGDQQSGGFQIETMNNAWPFGSAAGGELPGAVVEQGRGEGTSGPARAGMDGQAGRLVKDDDVGVLVKDVERDGLWLHMAGGGGGNADGDRGAGGKEITRLHGLAGGFDPTVLHPLLDFVAGFPTEAGEDEIGAFDRIGRAGGAVPDPFLGGRTFSARLLGMTGHAYLILPFFCSLVYAVGALFLKRSMEAGQAPRRVLVSSNLALGTCFLPLLLWAEKPPAGLGWEIWLTPVLCSGLFFLGQIGTFRALAGGDVSVATPILGTKVVMTAMIGAIFLPEGVPARLWLGAFLGTAGIALVGLQPGARTGKALRAIGWGLFAAAVFSLTDVLVARTARELGFCLFGPLMMLGMAVLSVSVMPPWQWPQVVEGLGVRWMVAGGACIGIQGVGLYATIALSGDPVGVNIVYAVRGLWSVLLVAWVGKWLGNREAGLPRMVLFLRGVGAALLLGAVWAVLG